MGDWKSCQSLGNTDHMKHAANRAVAADLQRYVRFFNRMIGNRRGPRRFPVFGTIYVKRSGYAAEYTCACFDISAGGIGIEVAGPITVGSSVTVRTGECGPRRPASVRYCIQEEDTFRAGLEFTG